MHMAQTIWRKHSRFHKEALRFRRRPPLINGYKDNSSSADDQTQDLQYEKRQLNENRCEQKSSCQDNSQINEKTRILEVFPGHLRYSIQSRLENIVKRSVAISSFIQTQQPYKKK